MISILMVIVFSVFVSAKDLSDYPDFFIDDDNLDVIVVVGDKAHSSHAIAQSKIVLSLTNLVSERVLGIAKLASEVDGIDDFNIISVGNACDNNMSAKILGNPEPCNNLESGEATIEFYENDKIHIVLNAYSDEGVKKAADVLSSYFSYDLNGNKFNIEVDEIEDAVLELDNEEDERQKIIEELNEKLSSPEVEESSEKEIIEDEEIDEGPKPILKEEDDWVKKIISWFRSLFGG